MSRAFHVRALTSVVRVEFDDSVTPEALELLTQPWADLRLPDWDGPATPVLRGAIGDPRDQPESRDGIRHLTATSAEELADSIASALTLIGIGDLAGEALMLHAAAVSLDDGRVIGFVGPSGRGKTTAALELGGSFGYVTDETLAVRPDGSVIPFPKPLSIGERPAHKRLADAAALGLRAAPADDLRLEAIVLLDRRPGLERPEVESVSLVDALTDLVPQTSYLAALPSPLRTLADLVRSTGGIRRVSYSEASTLASAVDEILATRHDDRAMLIDVSEESQRDCDCSRGAVEEPRPVGTYRRTKHSDALMVDDRLIVLRPNEVTVLDGLGPVVWLAASDSTDDDLREAALNEVGAPPPGIDATAVVAEAVAQLVNAELLAKR